MSSESTAAKARRYLIKGRVILTEVRPGRVTALVPGDGAIYAAGYSQAHWASDRPARSQACARIRAVRLVTAIDIQEEPCSAI